jgi:crotonobetainyl-CoA:carnitine CoA-transferase CaiB-like acyl-CoA transferase
VLHCNKDRRRAVEKGFADLGVAVDSAEQRESMLKTLNALFATDSRDKWVEILRHADIVSAPINTLLEASNDPDVLANGYVTEVDHPKYGKPIKVHGSPWQFSETPANIGIAPELGEHNVPILTRLGYTKAQIQALQEKNII